MCKNGVNKVTIGVNKVLFLIITTHFLPLTTILLLEILTLSTFFEYHTFQENR